MHRLLDRAFSNYGAARSRTLSRNWLMFLLNQTCYCCCRVSSIETFPPWVAVTIFLMGA